MTALAPKSIIVLTGSRAWDTDAKSRSWARGALVQTFALHGPDLVAHGAAPGWDHEGDSLAQWVGVPRAVFALSRQIPFLHLPGGTARPLADADRYRYDGPLPRNAALMRWAADRAADGHRVVVVGCIAPWSVTRGTRHAIEQAKALDLNVVEIEAPESSFPDDRDEWEGATR